MNIEVIGIEQESKDYHISIEEEIRRCLITKKGSIPMNPMYGSDLWKYRDRTLDDAVKLGIINESFNAIEYAVKRVKPKKVLIDSREDGNFSLKIEVVPR